MKYRKNRERLQAPAIDAVDDQPVHRVNRAGRDGAVLRRVGPRAFTFNSFAPRAPDQFVPSRPHRGVYGTKQPSVLLSKTSGRLASKRVINRAKRRKRGGR